MSVRDKIVAGDYDGPSYPIKPPMPAVMRKMAGNLSIDERETLSTVIADYDTAMNQWTTAKQNYESEHILRHKNFENDLAIEHGVASHKHRKRVFDMAWAQGHDEGLDLVAQIYEDLAELLK